MLIACSMVFLTACSEQDISAALGQDLGAIGQVLDAQIDERVEAALQEREAPAEEEKKVYEIEVKTVPIYYSEEETEDIELAFMDGNTDIPWISVKNAAAYLEYIAHEMGAKDYTLTVTEDGEQVTLTRETNYPAVIDFEESTIDFWDYDAFRMTSISPTLMDMVENTGMDEAGNAAFFQHSDTSYQRYGEAITIRPGDYNIDLIHQDDDYYIPLQLFSDFFTQGMRIELLYNGEAVFFVGYGNLLAPEAYRNVKERPEERNEELIVFNYRELCLALDSFYGLKNQHGIKDFHTLFMETGLISQLMSSDPNEAGQALWDLTFVHLDDLHSGFRTASWMTTEDPEPRRGTSVKRMVADMIRYAESRAKFYPDGCPGYEEAGNTAYITFDHFTYNGTDYYTEEAVNDPADTMGLMIYAYSQITREDSPIENVVLDLSNNGGGTATAAAYVIGMFLGDGTASVKDTLTEALVTQNFRIDANLDREFDEQDSFAELGYHLFCLISPNSFSCGNLLPSVLKESHIVTLIGQTSGGGACVVYPMTTADGNIFQISGPFRLAYTKNGSFYDIDQGVEPDFIIPTPDQFYDREKLTDYINGLLGK